MSDNYLILIPTDPNFVPEPVHQIIALKLLEGWLPDSGEIALELNQEVKFIHQGANFERILCPFCENELSVEEWGLLMDKSYENSFTDLIVQMPCCSQFCSLNNLNYQWPAGFSRIVLIAENPNGNLEIDQIKLLEEKLNCRLRKIWRHV